MLIRMVKDGPRWGDEMSLAVKTTPAGSGVATRAVTVMVRQVKADVGEFRVNYRVNERAGGKVLDTAGTWRMFKPCLWWMRPGLEWQGTRRLGSGEWLQEVHATRVLFKIEGLVASIMNLRQSGSCEGRKYRID